MQNQFGSDGMKGILFGCLVVAAVSGACTKSCSVWNGSHPPDLHLLLALFQAVEMFVAAQKELAAGDGGRGADRFG